MREEIFCGGGAGSSASSTVVAPASRSARRRRMEIRQVKLVAGSDDVEKEEAAPPEQEDDTGGGGKRRRVEPSCAAAEGVGAGSSSTPDASSDSERPRGRLAGSDRCPRYGMTSVCGRRREMEDAVSVRPDFLGRGAQVAGKHHFFGVFDGHGCSHVAMSCKSRMHELVAEEMERARGDDAAAPPPPPQPQEGEEEMWRGAMERSFSRMDAEATNWSGGGGGGGDGPRSGALCRCEQLTPMRCDLVGSTAVAAVVGPARIVVANCGDSRAVLSRDGVAIPLSSDHKPDRPDELQRIEAAGGRVIDWDGPRVNAILAMSRAIALLFRLLRW
ncbi:probable protein phosphatase 2C 49 isoform X2 [Ananas comosus]|uniref:protein-serine/threonine phosphatase n=1 Tax=Ananas comosus TaxID=4615 RepID=A0A6P5HHW6_ANACO|nr:probable protein phosphatase 2C 49 isoform X2 [Ananas comosus]